MQNKIQTPSPNRMKRRRMMKTWVIVMSATIVAAKSTVECLVATGVEIG